MVVVALQPASPYMERCGMGTSTRKVATRLWPGDLADRSTADLARELYAEENRGKLEPSGSQDMIGLIYPGVNRLDYDYEYEGGIFPKRIESNNDPAVAEWLERIVKMIPIAQRPEGYNPLGIKNLDKKWIFRLGQTGKDCYNAIVRGHLASFGTSLNDCMECWEAILPQTVRHPALTVDLLGILHHYQQRYAGAMYSGCGGGYLYVASDESVPGSMSVKVRIMERSV